MDELVDTHIHLDFDAYALDFDEVIARANSAGVTKIITIGAGGGIESSRAAVQISQKYPKIWAAIGIHPHDAGKDISFDEIERLASSDKVVAVGECGLDFFRDWSPVDAQREVFRFQIELAKRLKKPLIIHSRDAGTECLSTLIECNAKDVRGVFHCYGEDHEFAKKLADIGFLISITGTVTFKNAHKLREIVKNVPLEQIMLETDGPYMAPEPHRGSRSESAHVQLIARKVAEIKGITINEVCEATTSNVKRLFGI